jgi:hypothetical protein
MLTVALNLALLLLPALLAIVSTAVWWSTLTRPWLFGAVACLSLLGLQTLLREFLMQPTITNFVSIGKKELTSPPLSDQVGALVDLALQKSVAAMVILLIALGVPLLYWLKHGLSRT